MIDSWKEPSAALLQWSMSAHGYHVALHLSNLQKVRLPAQCSLSDADTRNMVGANILDLTASRNTYTKLAQGPVKIKEVFARAAGAGLMLWAPDDANTLNRWLKVWDGLNEEGTPVKLKLLTSFSPFPTCVCPIGILDFWSHPLLHLSLIHI